MKKILILLLAVSLNGCSLYHMNDNLRAMYGQPVEVAYQVLGIPDGAFNAQGVTIYVWNNSQKYSYNSPSSATTFGTFGMTPYHSYTSYNQTVNSVSTCIVKVVANRQGMIIQTDYDGGILACEKYADRLEAAFGR